MANKDVLVFIEQRSNQVQRVSLELLGKGRELADTLGGQLQAAVLGDKVGELAKQVLEYGADEVLVVDSHYLKEYTVTPYTKALTSLVQQAEPEILLIGATTIGRDLAPRLAARLETGLTADCTALEIDPETSNLLMTRPAFGGNLMATIICPDHRPQMSSVRPGVMTAPEATPGRDGLITLVSQEFTPEDLDIQVLKTVKETREKVRIEDAQVLVAGGRGLGGQENFNRLQDLAKLLNGEVAASRAVVDAGWAEHHRQVGQTGKTVRPNLYLALGISGAIQHVAGMEKSDLIIAVNRDPRASIFQRADLGIVGDVGQILPALISKLSELR
jgi:electron transfer flavoprotein alpha subunit